MSSQALKMFDRVLRAEVFPALVEQGFELGKARTLRRSIEHEGTRSTQIVEFQIGSTGSFVGKFTVNLAVFNPHFSHATTSVGQPGSWDCWGDLRARLGFFRPPKRSILDRITGTVRLHRDHWWCQNNQRSAMERELVEVKELLLSEGFRWFDQRTSIKAFQWALRELERRKDWIARSKAAGQSLKWLPEPFPTDV